LRQTTKKKNFNVLFRVVADVADAGAVVDQKRTEGRIVSQSPSCSAQRSNDPPLLRPLAQQGFRFSLHQQQLRVKTVVEKDADFSIE
jgi:hypothetical protein